MNIVITSKVTTPTCRVSLVHIRTVLSRPSGNRSLSGRTRVTGGERGVGSDTGCEEKERKVEGSMEVVEEG